MQNIWLVGGNLLIDRMSLCGCGTQSQQLQFGGTQDEDARLNNTEEYNGTTWSNSGVGTLIRQRYGHQGCGVQDQALSFGGIGLYGNQTESYNGSAWTNESLMIKKRFYLSGMGTNDHAIQIGGQNMYEIPLALTYFETTEEFINDQWQSGNSLSAIRANQQQNGTYTDGFISGGTSGSITTENCSNGFWISGPNLNTGRTQQQGLGNSSIGSITGGQRSDNSYLNSTENLENNVFTESANLNTARFQLQGCGTTGSGLSFGGYNGSNCAITEEYYNITNYTETYNHNNLLVINMQKNIINTEKIIKNYENTYLSDNVDNKTYIIENKNNAPIVFNVLQNNTFEFRTIFINRILTFNSINLNIKTYKLPDYLYDYLLIFKDNILEYQLIESIVQYIEKQYQYENLNNKNYTINYLNNYVIRRTIEYIFGISLIKNYVPQYNNTTYTIKEKLLNNGFAMTYNQRREISYISQSPILVENILKFFDSNHQIVIDTYFTDITMEFRQSVNTLLNSELLFLSIQNKVFANIFNILSPIIFENILKTFDISHQLITNTYFNNISTEIATILNITLNIELLFLNIQNKFFENIFDINYYMVTSTQLSTLIVSDYLVVSNKTYQDIQTTTHLRREINWNSSYYLVFENNLITSDNNYQLVENRILNNNNTYIAIIDKLIDYTLSYQVLFENNLIINTNNYNLIGNSVLPAFIQSTLLYKNEIINSELMYRSIICRKVLNNMNDLILNYNITKYTLNRYNNIFNLYNESVKDLLVNYELWRPWIIHGYRQYTLTYIAYQNPIRHFNNKYYLTLLKRYTLEYTIFICKTPINPLSVRFY